MNEVFILDHEFSFDSTIHEITSISIEQRYDVDRARCYGEFIISGDYRLHEISVNRENFSFKLPFETDVRNNVNLDSLEVEIHDFTYEAVEDTLSVHIEYNVKGEQEMIEFAEEADLEEFLKASDTEIVDLTEERLEEITEPEQAEEVIVDEQVEEEVVTESEPRVSQENLVSSINSEESYVTYHVHTVVTSDTFESISNQYNISINDLKRLNNIEDLSINLKLIIPDEEN